MANSPERTAVPLTSTPARRGASQRRHPVGWWLLVVGLVGAIALSFVPTPYVVQEPGPVFDTLGTVEVDGEERDLIVVEGETFETDGSLDLLTVSVIGSRQTRTGWFTVISAWFDPARSVLPLDAVYPEGTSFEDAEAARRIDMENSQREAVAAALRELGHEIDGTLTVASVEDGLPSEGLLEVGDTIVTVGGERFTDVSSLRGTIGAHGTDSAVTVTVERDGETLDVPVTPATPPGASGPVLGIGVRADYDFPIDVDFTLDSVGGPSAGMMFALAIIDKLTPGAATGGEHIAGTGTITAAGSVGAIGGVRQKMYGAVHAGADWMLVPLANCPQVVGGEPAGLRVVPVSTLDEARDAVDAIAAGQAQGLPACTP